MPMETYHFFFGGGGDFATIMQYLYKCCYNDAMIQYGNNNATFEQNVATIMQHLSKMLLQSCKMCILCCKNESYYNPTATPFILAPTHKTILISFNIITLITVLSNYVPVLSRELRQTIRPSRHILTTAQVPMIPHS